MKGLTYILVVIFLVGAIIYNVTEIINQRKTHNNYERIRDSLDAVIKQNDVILKQQDGQLIEMRNNLKEEL